MNPFVLLVTGSTVIGSTVTVEISGLVPGEQTYLLGSPDLGSECHSVVTPTCAALDAPLVLAQGTPLGTSATVEVTLPSVAGTYYLQAVSTSATSVVTQLDVRDSPTFISGVDFVCDYDEADVSVEHFGGLGSTIRVNVYEAGALVVGYDEPATVPAPGDIFVLTSLEGISAPSCAAVTWTVETVNTLGTVDHCVVRGPEEASLITAGLIPSSCQEI